MGNLEQHYVKEAFDTNWIAPLGPNVTGFESDIANYLGDQVLATALSSGTAAIHLGLLMLGVSHGDEVMCQSFTFSASANPITYLGARPIFIDSERDTWNLSPELLETAITERIQKGKKPKAIVAVHLYGMPYKVDEIHEIALKYEIPVLEDSAEALGSSYYERKCGTFGDIAVLSFNGNKIITTSGGGALISKNKDYTEKALFLATQSRENEVHYEHEEIGFNYRMSNVVAGIGRGQMRVLEDRVHARRRNFQFYKDELSSHPDIIFLNEIPGNYSNRWLSCILTPSFEVRERIRMALLDQNIESRPLWKPMHEQPVFKENLAYVNGVSLDLFQRGLCLPSGSNLEKEHLERITFILKQILS
ncbi:aminotransferase class I/II-fold pyridoxal phosphate-dependent enzyme [Muriicola jejuensis]|uniref:Aminotransferase class I/II-fold pyridoxal phosphate-dependent enzyme n=2 Tax=Muriicola jejuensis TaxID=504488 RepID=A0A6P0UET1_9FLAO|nr:aminotransferase class I/II-fold pyridoxal phosphate-dependent enzyme [Muriicola jejuensis]NER11517.1 aminotransferase class I/II-fold pyridoxal phosphate-dependent enzyme [Muriicola jejuensis]